MQLCRRSRSTPGAHGRACARCGGICPVHLPPSLPDIRILTFPARKSIRREIPAVSLTGHDPLTTAFVGMAEKLTRRIDCFDECGKKVPDLGKEFKKLGNVLK